MGRGAVGGILQQGDLRENVPHRQSAGNEARNKRGLAVASPFVFEPCGRYQAARASLARPTIWVKASGSLTARSASIFLLMSTPACLRPCMKRL